MRLDPVCQNILPLEVSGRLKAKRRGHPCRHKYIIMGYYKQNEIRIQEAILNPSDIQVAAGSPEFEFERSGGCSWMLCREQSNRHARGCAYHRRRLV